MNCKCILRRAYVRRALRVYMCRFLGCCVCASAYVCMCEREGVIGRLLKMVYLMGSSIDPQ